MKQFNRIILNIIYLYVYAIVAITASTALAEYRSYQYVLNNNNPDKKTPTILTTSLHPQAMSRYYGISKQNLYLLRTWICPGNTAGKKTCLPPYQAKNLESFLQNDTAGNL